MKQKTTVKIINHLIILLFLIFVSSSGFIGVCPNVAEDTQEGSNDGSTNQPITENGILENTTVSHSLSDEINQDAQADGIQPTIVKTVPLYGLKDASVSDDISIEFSEDIDPLTLTNDNIMITEQDVSIVDKTITYDKQLYRVALDPSSNLSYSKKYSVLVKKEIADLAGNTLADDYVFEFVTESESSSNITNQSPPNQEASTPPDREAPTVIATSPINAITNVSPNLHIVITFSEPIKSSTLTTNSILLTSGASIVSGLQLSYDSTHNKLTIVPLTLSGGTIYTVSLTDQITDFNSNSLSNVSFSFTTEVLPESTLLSLPTTDTSLSAAVVVDNNGRKGLDLDNDTIADFLIIPKDNNSFGVYFLSSGSYVYNTSQNPLFYLKPQEGQSVILASTSGASSSNIRLIKWIGLAERGIDTDNDGLVNKILLLSSNNNGYPSLLDAVSPSLNVASNSKNYISINGYTSSNLSWSSNQSGSYTIKVGENCQSNVYLGGSLGTSILQSQNISSVIYASDLATGLNKINVCFTNIYNVSTSIQQSITRDDVSPATTASVGGGNFSSIQSVELSCNSCSKIAYTTNGTTPTFDSGGNITNGTLYTAAWTTPNPAQTALKFRAIDDAGNIESVQSQTYNVDSADPNISIASVERTTLCNGGTNKTSNIVWSSNRSDLAYSIKIGGSSCSNATVSNGTNASGTTSLSNITSQIKNTDLTLGSNTVRLCVTNLANNTTQVTQSLTLDPPCIEGWDTNTYAYDNTTKQTKYETETSWNSTSYQAWKWDYYIKFDVTALADSGFSVASGDSAKFQTYYFSLSGSPPSTGQLLAGYVMTEPWHDSKLTYWNAPAVNSSFGTIPSWSSTFATPNYGYKELVISNELASWISGSNKNYGISLRNTQENGGGWGRYNYTINRNVKGEAPRLVVTIAGVTTTYDIIPGSSANEYKTLGALYGSGTTAYPELSGHDTNVSQHDPTVTYGTDGSLYIGNYDGWKFRSYIKIDDPSQIPDTCTTTYLRLFFYTWGGDGASRIAYGYKVTSSWIYNTLTYNSMPTYQNSAISPSGNMCGNGTLDACDDRWVWYDITSLVSGWKSSPSTNYGIIVNSTDGSGGNKYYYSMNQGTGSKYYNPTIRCVSSSGVTDYKLVEP